MKHILSFLVTALFAVCAYATPTETLIAVLPAPVSHTTVEAPDVQLFLNPGDIQAGDELHIHATGYQLGAVNYSQLHVRLGTAGTPSDFDLNGHSGQSFLNTTMESGGTEIIIKFLDNTHAIRTGGIAGQGSYYWVQAAYTNPDTLPFDISTTSLYLTFSAVSSGTGNPVVMQTLKVYRVRP